MQEWGVADTAVFIWVLYSLHIKEGQDTSTLKLKVQLLEICD